MRAMLAIHGVSQFMTEGQFMALANSCTKCYTSRALAKQRWGDFVTTKPSAYCRTLGAGFGKAKENDILYPQRRRFFDFAQNDGSTRDEQ